MRLYLLDNKLRECFESIHPNNNKHYNNNNKNNNHDSSSETMELFISKNSLFLCFMVLTHDYRNY